MSNAKLTTLLLAACCWASSACSSDSSTNTDTGVADAGRVDSGRADMGTTQPDSGVIEDARVVEDAGVPSDCFMNPTTHLEIINACTTADKVDKMPVLPLLNPDGTLPAVP